ncbi:uncharacterized protein LTR77_010312 [Saxophila tyrrhenica]|uniref:Uncharacterized protein n=1 Tax=Saxophila tyrrhenica TaxID=1690608 RepID=A0AAV9NZG3_9PEZI|nr:hypothetical protein LTR77_010312 [Saxophila tyrrhenica]
MAVRRVEGMSVVGTAIAQWKGEESRLGTSQQKCDVQLQFRMRQTQSRPQREHVVLFPLIEKSGLKWVLGGVVVGKSSNNGDVSNRFQKTDREQR